MPLYVYRCCECENEIEILEKSPNIRHSIVCEMCERETRHKIVYKNTNIRFKGSGFYTTENRNYERYNRKYK